MENHKANIYQIIHYFEQKLTLCREIQKIELDPKKRAIYNKLKKQISFLNEKIQEIKQKYESNTI